MAVTIGKTTLTSDEGTTVLNDPQAFDMSVFDNQNTPNVTNRLQSQAPNQSVSSIDPATQQFTVDTPDTFEAEDVMADTDISDVNNARFQAEAAVAPTQDPLDEIQQGVDTPVETSRFDDVDQFIDDQIYGEIEPTETEKSRQQIIDDFVERVTNIESNLNLTESDAREQYRLAEREKELAETDLRIAEKTKALRQRLRRFDADPERRALNRSAFTRERQKIEADATAELADEYIIQAAQTGNLQRAEALVQTAVENRIRSFQLRNQADQAQLDALIPTLEGEEKQRALQLQFALQERERNIAEVKAEQEGIHNMMITAATNGAPGDLQRQILGAKSLNDAMVLAGPYIGRNDRVMREAQLANIYSQINERQSAARLRLLESMGDEETEKEAAAEQSLSLWQVVTQLSEHDGLNAAVGFGTKKSIVGRIPFVSGAAVEGTSRADFEALANRAANLLTIENLDLMSGVLSETDIQILESAGSNLANFDMSEDAYKQEIARVNNVMLRNIKTLGITPEQASFYGVFDDSDLEEVDSIYTND